MNLKKMLNKAQGFTLIELLVVITLIAILAVAILAAINPVEQRRKATDTGARSTAVELNNALERYYATFGCYPWDQDATAPGPGICDNLTTANRPNMRVNAADGAAPYFEYLVESGEMKDQVLANLRNAGAGGLDVLQIPVSTIHVNEEGPTDQLSVCFNPISNSFQTEADNTGTASDADAGLTVASTCTLQPAGGASTANDCHICVPNLLN